MARKTCTIRKHQNKERAQRQEKHSKAYHEEQQRKTVTPQNQVNDQNDHTEEHSAVKQHERFTFKKHETQNFDLLVTATNKENKRLKVIL